MICYNISTIYLIKITVSCHEIKIRYHCWTESMVSSLVDLQEGQLIAQYYYVSNSNKHVNRKDEELMIIWPYYSGFC